VLTGGLWDVRPFEGLATRLRIRSAKPGSGTGANGPTGGVCRFALTGGEPGPAPYNSLGRPGISTLLPKVH